MTVAINSQPKDSSHRSRGFIRTLSFLAVLLHCLVAHPVLAQESSREPRSALQSAIRDPALGYVGAAEKVWLAREKRKAAKRDADQRKGQARAASESVSPATSQPSPQSSGTSSQPEFQHSRPQGEAAEARSERAQSQKPAREATMQDFTLADELDLNTRRKRSTGPSSLFTRPISRVRKTTHSSPTPNDPPSRNSAYQAVSVKKSSDRSRPEVPLLQTGFVRDRDNLQLDTPSPSGQPAQLEPLPVKTAPVSTKPCMTLDDHEIGCLAANQWVPADLLRQRGCTLVKSFCKEDDCQRAAAQTLAVFLNMQAKYQENLGAASALRAYYSRIAIAEQSRLNALSLEYINEEENKQVAAQRQGLPATADLSSFERLKLESEDNRLQIESKDRQLRSLLVQLTGVDYGSEQVCQEFLQVHSVSLDCEQLKQHALVLRQDLQAWQHLGSHVNEESAPIFAQMLSTIIGGWGLPLPKVAALKAVFCKPDYTCLVANLRREISLTIEINRRWIEHAVSENCESLKVAYQRMELAKRVIESWERRVEQLEALESSGQSAAVELATARSELLKAHAEEIRRRLEAKLAEIDLAEACGGLADRCCQKQPWLLTGFEGH
ncbi:MAG: TolC family protein [Planctomycetota bacterium]|nr:TolC family protein [Planctomycetota bacterium]